MFTANHSVPHKPRANRILLLCLLICAFGLRVVALDRLGLAYDEAASAMMARATPAAIVNFHWHAAFEHPPVWALLLHMWSAIAGQSEIALRLLPASGGVLSVALTWSLARAIWPRDQILPMLSALAVTLSPVLVYYSQEARMYTLVVALLLLAVQLGLRLRAAPSWWLVLAYVLTCWAMLGLHYFAALGLAIQAAVFGIDAIVQRLRRTLDTPSQPISHLLVAFAGAVLPVALWLLFAPGFHTTLAVVLDKAGDNPVSWQYFLSDLWRELSFGSIRFPPAYATWGYTLVPLVLLGAALALGQPQETRFARTGAWLIVALVVLPIVSAAIGLRTLVPRYILWVVPMIYLLALLPAAALWRRRRFASIALCLLVVGVELLALYHYFGPYRKSDFRDMTSYLDQQGNTAREILLLEAPRQHLLIKYYLPPRWEFHPMPTIALPDYWPVTAPLLVPEDEDDRIQEWFATYDGLWVSYSSEAEVDGGEFLAKYLTAVAYRERCTQWLDARLCHYVSPRHVTPQTLDTPTILFGDELALEAVHATLYAPPDADASLLAQLDWHARQTPSIDYKVALRLVAPDGSVVDEWNDFPIGPLLPPSTWNAQDRKPGYMALRLPAGIEAGRYSLQVSVYDPATLTPSAYVTADQPGTTAPFTLGTVVSHAQGDDTMHPIISFE